MCATYLALFPRIITLGLRAVLKLYPEKANGIENNCKPVEHTGEYANYVYVSYHFDVFNETGDDYLHG